MRVCFRRQLPEPRASAFHGSTSATNSLDGCRLTSEAHRISNFAPVGERWIGDSLPLPPPLFLRKIFKRQDLGVDLMLQNLENKGPEGLHVLGSWKASRTG